MKNRNDALFIMVLLHTRYIALFEGEILELQIICAFYVIFVGSDV